MQQDLAMETDNNTDLLSLNSREQRFILFVGPNADKFLEVYRKLNDKKNPISLNWVAFFFAVPWFFYRKMYLWGIALLLVPVILITLFPTLSDANLAISGIFLIMGNRFYVEIANRKIKKVEAMDLSAEECNEYLRNAGGVSPIGAVFGSIILIAVLALVVIDIFAN